MPPIRIRFGGYQPPTPVHNKAAGALGRSVSTVITATSHSPGISSGRRWCFATRRAT
jgi:hypothetical protein